MPRLLLGFLEEGISASFGVVLALGVFQAGDPNPPFSRREGTGGSLSFGFYIIFFAALPSRGAQYRQPACIVKICIAMPLLTWKLRTATGGINAK